MGAASSRYRLTSVASVGFGLVCVAALVAWAVAGDLSIGGVIVAVVLVGAGSFFAYTAWSSSRMRQIRENAARVLVEKKVLTEAIVWLRSGDADRRPFLCCVTEKEVVLVSDQDTETVSRRLTDLRSVDWEPGLRNATLRLDFGGSELVLRSTKSELSDVQAALGD